MADVSAILNSAAAHHQTGRFADAEAGYRAVLVLSPKQFDAIYRLGVLCLQTNRLADSEHWLRQGLAIQPHSPELLSTLAVVLASTSRQTQAISMMRRAIAIHAAPPMHNNLANMLREAKQFDQAIIEYERAITLQPDYIEAMARLGSLLVDLKRYPEAIAVHRRCASVAPAMAEVQCNLSWALGLNENRDDALIAARRATELNPNLADAWLCLGDALSGNKLHLDTAAAHRKAIALKPDSAPAHRGLGNALLDIDQMDESLHELREAIRLEPDYGDTHWDYSLALIKTGKFLEAWPEFEWRHRKKVPNTPRQIGKPRWTGEPLNGRKIFLQGEQAFGDRIQFIRFANLVAQAGGRVVIDTLPELNRLFQSLNCIEQIILENEPVPPDVELCCPVLSLPMIFQTTQATIPAPPYLFADPLTSQQWAERLGPPTGKRRIGIIWAGRLKPDPARTCPLECWNPILSSPGVEFYSLQIGDSEPQLASSPFAWRITDYSDQLRDFADTAAFMSQLDLIITIDTATAHLAGALGRTVWVVLKHHADYRWMLNRTDSPWYPEMKLFRQPTPDDWDSVMSVIAQKLRLGFD